ncbi:hypothetical protein HJC23_010340 [Cyclotella cryptica]|uniref:Chitin-binding type-1 domain-containing protein n=1 Tax=Cyclotella cryptica TaxID=29204 RepID=A0ABD3QQX4_9STRA
MFSFNKLVFIALAAFADAHPHPLVRTSVENGSTCATDTAMCGPGLPCANGMCCSQWGYCGTTEDYCGTCCQNNCMTQGQSTTNRSGGGSINSSFPTMSPTISGFCAKETAMCGPGRHCDGGMCCSQWGVRLDPIPN